MRRLLWTLLFCLLPFSLKSTGVMRIDVITITGDTLSAYVEALDTLPFDTTLVFCKVAEMYVAADSSDTTGFNLLWNPGDIDRSGQIDISDLMLLIDYIFLGGEL